MCSATISRNQSQLKNGEPVQRSGLARSKAAPIAEMDVLWLTAGLRCDGDANAMTAATQQSIEDVLRLWR
jgi:hypothetical protein